MGTVVSTLTADEVQQAIALEQTIAQAAVPTMQAGQFVFFAAFDGTNNNKYFPSLSNDPQSTNVGQLSDQVEMASAFNPNLGSNYYPGPGTPGTLPGSSFLPPQVTQQIFDTANKAYSDFADQAAKWLDANPGGSITTAITGFSRGGPTAVVFSQLLNERGLIDPRNGNVLIQPGQVDVSAMLLLDPVSTGFYGDLNIPSNVNANNIVVVQALDEYRILYKGDDYSADPRVRVVDFYGNHGDVGGFYDQGLGALVLQGITGFFRNTGLTIADVPIERQFDGDWYAVIHTEGIDSYGNRIWDEYGTRGSRLLRAIGYQQPTQIINNGFYYSTTSLNDAGQLTMTVDRDVSGHRVVVEFMENEWGDLIASRVLSVDGQTPANSEAFADALGAQGYDAWNFADGVTPSGGADLGNLYTAFNPMQPTGSQTLANVFQNGTLIDALSLLRAIQAGEPLPVISSGLQFAVHLNSTNSTLNGSYNIVAGALSVLNLKDALDQGDTLAAITAGAQAFSFGAQAYLNFVEYEAGLESAVDFLGNTPNYDAAGNLVGNTPGPLAYLNIVNSLAHGDMVGAAINALYFTPAAPIAIAYQVFNLVSGLFGDDDPGRPPEPWGTASAAWSGATIVANTAGEHGGQEIVSDTYNGFLSYLNQLAAQTEAVNPGSAVGVIANRLPSIDYRGYAGYQLINIDPITGVQSDSGVVYDTSGANFSERFLNVALDRGAIAPMWEVETAIRQTLLGDPQAGLPEEERAGRNGQLAPPVSGDTQTFRPVAFDLDGDGIETTGETRSVAFDVDDSGFLKNTAWLGNDDAFLFLDRNLNGQIDSGKELFSNSAVALGARGLAGMRWIDSNYDQKITDADPVWDELKLWHDADGDGAADAGEVSGLSTLGITALDYVLGRYEQNGQIKQLASPDLAADTEGVRTHVIPEGIVIETSGGHTSLIVTRIDDRTVIEANRDSLTTFEDIETIISGADLRANDTLGGFLGADLTITGVSNFAHGTGYLDDNGFIHFTPDANYSGAASFNYTIQAPTGQSDTATVDIVLTPTNDAPVIETIEYGRPLYAYENIVIGANHPDYRAVDDFYRNVGDYVYYPRTLDFSRYEGTSPLENHGMSFIVGRVNQRFIDYSYDSGDTTYEYTLTLPIYDPSYAATLMAQGRAVDLNWNPVTPTYYRNGMLRPIMIDPTDAIGSNNGASVREDSPYYYEGRVISYDPDGDISGLSYTVHSYPAHGKAATGNDWNDYTWFGGFDGNRHYAAATPEHWIYQGTECDSYVGYAPFTIAVTDAQGASTTVQINTNHRSVCHGGGGGKPIAIDLGNNGFAFTDVNDSNVFYDINGDGFRHRTAWPTADDGLLAYDLDGNGIIEKQGEISFTSYLPGAQTDLEGLKAFDTNNDGVLSSADEKWTKFGVWQDVDQDGITDAGEFQTLSELGVQSMALTSDGQFAVVDGQTVHGVGTITKTDGSMLNFADITLRYNNEVLVQNADGTTQVVMREPFSPSGEELTGTEDNDLILGKTGNNLVYAYGGDDVVFEDGGNDVIDGGTGNDTIYSGADNDIVMGGDGNDVVFAGLGNDLVIGGDGNDAILAEGGNDVAFGGDGNDLVAGGYGNDVLSGDLGNDQVYGESGNDALFGMDGDDELAGMDGHDLLNGGAGNDLLDGGEGIDQMTGGAGDDTYVVDNAEDTVTENPGEGTDTVRASIDYTLGTNLENLTLTGTQDLNGTGNELDNVLTGNAGANTLIGRAGNDTLDGGAGADALIGGTGDDLYVVDNAADMVEENADEGTDTVRASVSHALSANVENLALTGLGDVDGSGNDLDNLIVGNRGANVLDGQAGADTMMGGRGDDTYIVDSAVDTVMENLGEGSDTVRSSISYALGANLENLTLTGTADLDGTGNELDNVLAGNDGNNVLVGGQGDDALIGGAGDDTYYYNLGDGSDTVLDTAGTDTLALAGVALADLNTSMSGNDLVLELPDGNNITIQNWFLDPTYHVETVSLDGTAYNASFIEAWGHAPVLAAPVPDMDTDEDRLFNLDISAYFTDVDLSRGDVLSYSAVLSSGSDLPTWLSFDANTGTFTGIPLQADVGSSLDIQLTATDSMGRFASEAFTLTVNNVNDVPVVANSIADQVTDEDSPFSFTLPAQTFADEDSVLGDTLALSAALVDGTELPTWLTFDAATGTFTGTPDNWQVGTYDLRVTATDLAGTSASDVFSLTVNNVNDNPVLANALGDLATDEDAPFSFSVPVGTFDDDDFIHGDSLTLSAALWDGSVLPDWLTFDAATGTFSGTPDNWDVGNYEVRLTATDVAGLSVSDTFTLAVNNVNDAPVVANAIPDRLATEGTAFSYAVAGDTFADDDTIHGDTLSYAATLADGSDLLSWLSFDANTQTFTGTAPVDSVLTGTDGDDVLVDSDTGISGTWDIKVTATDTSGVNTEDNFTLTLQGVAGNDTLNGGKGNDVLNGGGGDDTYLYNYGDGLDTLSDREGQDTVAFGAEFSFDNTVIRVDSATGVAHLRFLDDCGCETDEGMDITLNPDGSSPIETFAFTDGSSYTLADLTIQQKTWYGTNKANTIITGRHDDTIYAGKGGDVVYSGTGNDTVYGEKGNDKLYGEGGNDALYGDKGDDYLNGGCGNDILDGGKGHNTLIGGEGNDTLILAGDSESNVLFNLGDGWDTLKTAVKDEGHDNDIHFGSGITQENLWFTRNGDNLLINILGTQDGMTLEGWYTSKHRPIEEIETANGYELEDRKIELLVQAMAAFSPTPGSGNVLPAEMPDSLQPVLAAAWESHG